MKQKLKVLGLFSGIGGFELGLQRAGFEISAMCEIEPFCRRVLAKHWPGIPIYEDVRELTGERLAADGIGVDVICGGFPCQDVSTAGKRAGLEGERSGLWFEYARIVGDVRPRYVIVENTPGLLSRGMGTVLGGLAALGYNAEWESIPASALGAPHQRDRVWIIAYLGQKGQSNAKGRSRPPRPLRWQVSAANIFGRGIHQWPREPSVGRVVHGVSAGMDTAAAIAALGNAVVPQIPELIGKAILESIRD